MSLRALADKVGVSAPFLSDLEHGRRGTERAQEFARALGADPKEFEALSGKIDSEMKAWIRNNPDVIELLTEMRASGRPVEEVRVALRSGRKRAR